MKTKPQDLGNNTFQFLHWSKVAKTYPEAVNKVLEELKSSRPFYNYREGEISEKSLRETDRKKEMIEKVTKKGVVTIIVQLGEKYKGVSVKDARAKFDTNEFGLGAYEVACILLAKPSILEKSSDLYLDCAGDEYSYADGQFGSAPIFSWYDGKLEFDTDWFYPAGGYCGSVSAFLPQSNLESRSLGTVESPLTLETDTKSDWKYSYDSHTEYIKIGEKGGSETIEIRNGLNLDIHEGKIVGIEIIDK